MPEVAFLLATVKTNQRLPLMESIPPAQPPNWDRLPPPICMSMLSGCGCAVTQPVFSIGHCHQKINRQKYRGLVLLCWMQSRPDPNWSTRLVVHKTCAGTGYDISYWIHVEVNVKSRKIQQSPVHFETDQLYQQSTGCDLSNEHSVL